MDFFLLHTYFLLHSDVDKGYVAAQAGAIGIILVNYKDRGDGLLRTLGINQPIHQVY